MQLLEPITRIRKSYHIKCYRIPTPGSIQYPVHLLQLPEQDFVFLSHPKSKSLLIQKDCKANFRDKTLFPKSTSKFLVHKKRSLISSSKFCFNAYVSNSILLVLVSHLLTGLQVPVPSCLVSDISNIHLWIYHNTGTADVFLL